MKERGMLKRGIIISSVFILIAGIYVRSPAVAQAQETAARAREVGKRCRIGTGIEHVDRRYGIQCGTQDE